MSVVKKILTQKEANQLYDRGLAILEGTYGLATRTARYVWDPNAQHYELDQSGFRVMHSAGARWDVLAKRFVFCVCPFCERKRAMGEELAEVAPYHWSI
jgi:hypothetical protein